MKAAMHIGARTMKTRSIKASSWRKGKGKATYEIFLACTIAAVPSESTCDAADGRCSMLDGLCSMMRDGG